MTAQVPFNPVLTSVASGSFNTSSVGYIQGVAMDDPMVRNALAGGILDTSETIPLWGGVGIFEYVAGVASAGYLGSAGGPSAPLGGIIGRATAPTGSKALTGFSVFDQNYSAIQTPQSPVPLVGSRMTANFYRLGSGARIAVKADASLAGYDGTAIITTPVAWDYVNQMLIPQVTSVNVSSGTYSGTTITLTTASPHGINVGDTVTVAGLTGTGDYDSANGTFTAIAGTTGSTLKYTVASGLTMTISTTGTVTTGAALNVKLLNVDVGNSVTVSYDPTTGFATWDRNGTVALIQI